MNKTLYIAIAFASLNALMLAGQTLFSKLLANYFGPIEINFFRNCISFLFLLFFIVPTGKAFLLKTDRPFAHLIRSAIGTAGIVIGTWAITMMPLAEVTILLFTSPLFTVLLSYPILREKVGPFRLGAVLVGFLGVIAIALPTTSGETLPLLGIILGLIWGLASGSVDICLRWMGKTENAMATTFYFMLFGTLTTSLHWPWAEIKDNSFSLDALWIILGLGVCGLTAQISKAQSYRLGEASIIAPIMYTMIVWNIIFDYIFWNKIPSINLMLGATIIISSNLFILYRETRGKKKS